MEHSQRSSDDGVELLAVFLRVNRFKVTLTRTFHVDYILELGEGNLKTINCTVTDKPKLLSIHAGCVGIVQEINQYFH